MYISKKRRFGARTGSFLYVTLLLAVICAALVFIERGWRREAEVLPRSGPQYEVYNNKVYTNE